MLERTKWESGQIVQPESSSKPLAICCQTPILELMSRPNVCVSPNLSVEGLTSLLLDNGLTAVSVVDGEGELVGVASTTDLLREVRDRNDGDERIPLRASSPQGVQVEIGAGFHATYLARATVEEILTPFAFTLPETASVAQAAALLALEGLDQIAVLGPDDQIVGALTTLDVVRWLAEQSEFPLPATAPTQGGGYAARARHERRLRVMSANFAREIAAADGVQGVAGSGEGSTRSAVT